MYSRWRELLAWRKTIPEERKALFVDITNGILRVDSEALKLIASSIRNHVTQSLVCGDSEFIPESMYADVPWEQRPWRIVHEVTQDMSDARWWLFVFVIDTALDQQDRLELLASESP